MSWATNRRSRMKTLRAVVHRFSEHEGPLQWQYGGPMQFRSPWALATIHDIAKAKDLEMIAAYFAPMGGMLKRIGAVARRGRAGSSPRPSRTIARPSTPRASTYSRLLRRGAEVFEYQPTKLHSKLVVIDDAVHIGSSNFDIRSLYLNLEMMLRVHDAAFAAMMRGYFEHELGNSLQITPEAHERAGWFSGCAGGSAGSW